MVSKKTGETAQHESDNEAVERELQKSMGCMAGFFKMLDRPRILSPKKLFGAWHKARRRGLDCVSSHLSSVDLSEEASQRPSFDSTSTTPLHIIPGQKILALPAPPKSIEEEDYSDSVEKIDSVQDQTNTSRTPSEQHTVLIESQKASSLRISASDHGNKKQSPHSLAAHFQGADLEPDNQHGMRKPRTSSARASTVSNTSIYTADDQSDCYDCLSDDICPHNETSTIKTTGSSPRSKSVSPNREELILEAQSLRSPGRIRGADLRYPLNASRTDLRNSDSPSSDVHKNLQKAAKDSPNCRVFLDRMRKKTHEASEKQQTQKDFSVSMDADQRLKMLNEAKVLPRQAKLARTSSYSSMKMEMEQSRVSTDGSPSRTSIDHYEDEGTISASRKEDVNRSPVYDESLPRSPQEGQKERLNSISSYTSLSRSDSTGEIPMHDNRMNDSDKIEDARNSGRERKEKSLRVDSQEPHVQRTIVNLMEPNKSAKSHESTDINAGLERKDLELKENDVSGDINGHLETSGILRPQEGANSSSFAGKEPPMNGDRKDLMKAKEFLFENSERKTSSMIYDLHTVAQVLGIEKSNPYFRYITEIMIESGLLDKDTEAVFHSVDFVIDPKLFNFLEDRCSQKQSSQNKDAQRNHLDREVSFLLVNEILCKKLTPYVLQAWSCSPKNVNHTRPYGYLLLKQVISEFFSIQPESGLPLSLSVSTPADQDLSRTEDEWLDYTAEQAQVIEELDEVIFEDLINEMLRDYVIYK